jgi:hypothetical protein
MARDRRAFRSSGSSQTISNCKTENEICLRGRPAMQQKTIVAVIAAGFAVVLASCATLQVPLAELSFPPPHTLRESRDEIDVGARPMVSEDDYLKLFDDFPPDIGIAALWVEVKNARATAIEIQPSNWRLLAGNRSFHVLSVQDVFDRYYQGRNIRMYTTGADRDAKQKMKRVSFENRRIEPSMKRAGLVFFAIDPALASGWEHGAMLSLADIQLARGSKIAIQVKISHANS